MQPCSSLKVCTSSISGHVRLVANVQTPGLINTFGVHLLRYLNNISVWWHAVGTTALVIAILAKAPTHQTGKFVFQTFVDGTGVDGPGWSVRASPAYVVVVGSISLWALSQSLTSIRITRLVS